MIPDPNIVKFTRTLSAGEMALFRREARKKVEFKVSNPALYTIATTKFGIKFCVGWRYVLVGS